jgi:hypothetical protein
LAFDITVSKKIVIVIGRQYGRGSPVAAIRRLFWRTLSKQIVYLLGEEREK